MSVSVLAFYCLCLSVALYTMVGWVLVFSVVPLYLFPMALGFVVLLTANQLRLTKPILFFGFVTIALGLWALLPLSEALDEKKALLGALGWFASAGLMLFSAFAVSTWSRFVGFVVVYAALHLAGLSLGAYQYLTNSGYLASSAYVGGVAGFEGMNYAFGKNYLPLLALGIASVLLRIQGERPAIPWSRAMLIISFVGIAISGSRSTQIAALVGLAFSVLLIRKRAWAVPIVLTLCAGLFGGIIALSDEKWFQIAEGDPLSGDVSTTLRIAAWKAIYYAVRDHWLYGVGSFNFRYHLVGYLDPRDLGIFADSLLGPGSNLVMDPHNVILGVLIEHGIPGAILFSTFYIGLFIFGYRLWRNPRASAEQKLVGVFMTLFVLMFGIDMQLHNYSNENNLWVFAGLLLAAPAWRVARHATVRHYYVSSAVPSGSLAAQQESGRHSTAVM